MQRSHSGVSGGRTAGGFSLIELLTVIAIIAIITAVLLPVFATVRENGRQKSVMSNLHTISTALGQFTLDNHRAPTVLFGYAYPGSSMTSGYSAAQSANKATQFFPGLYPQFVKDPAVFFDPNNPETNDLADITDNAGAGVSIYSPNGAALTAITDVPGITPAIKIGFYKADAYDISPQVTDSNTISTTTYVPRYQQSWTSVMGASPTGISKQDYDRQMRFPNAPGETYVTCSTYHVPKGKVIVLWENGEAKVIDTERFLRPGPDVAALGVSMNVSNANFWKVTP